MNYLITGGCGFIGSHILRQLKKQGHNPIAYDIQTSNTSIEQILSPEEIRSLTVIQGGLESKDALVKVMRNHRIEVVIHLAALLGRAGEDDRTAAVQVNIIGTINVFEAALEAGIKRVVWASTQTVFGSSEFYRSLYPGDLVPNYALPRPSWVYGATKTFCEFLGELYHDRFGLETIGLRYCIVFGIARMRGLVEFAANLINKPAIGLPGEVDGGDSSPCWIYVEDAARAAILASQCPNPKSRNFIIGGDVVSMSDVRAYVLKLLPDADIKLKPGVFPSAYNLDLSAAEEELGFKREYSVFDGVHETINLVRKQNSLSPV
jgi:nucleoside-diphosphate-sugar epimerase